MLWTRRGPLLLLLAASLACGGGGGGGSARETVLYTEADDQRVGEQASLQVGGQIGFVEDAELAAYVDAVGKRLARHAPRGRYPYQFKVVDQDEPNAFALPGGYIYVSRGLLILSNTEEELAGVLGHEIIHVAARHAAARQALIKGMPGPMQLLAAGAIAGYGRDQEREADRLGQGLAALSGYDPDGLARFLRSMEFQERLHLGNSRLPRFYDTHPATSERIAGAASRARGVAWNPDPPIAGGHENYLRRIEGLLVGTGAHEGVFQGARFLHPELQFSVRFPSGWRLQNTRQAVGAVNARGDAVVFLEHQGFGDDPEVASARFLSSPKGSAIRVDTYQPIRIGALPGYRIRGRAGGGRGGIQVQLTWVAYRGSIYLITGASVPPANRYEGTFRAVARSFRPLAPSAAENIEQRRLRVVIARAGESLQAVSERTGNTWDLQQTAVVNGLFATATLQSGQPIKVAVKERYRSG